jgi:hypothetical protein
MPSIVRKAGLAAAVVILSYNATLAGPAQPARNHYPDGQFYSELTPFGLGPAQYYYEDPLRSQPRSTRRTARSNSYRYNRSSPSRGTVCTQIRNDYPERNFSCP